MELYEIDNVWQFFTERSGNFMIQRNIKNTLVMLYQLLKRYTVHFLSIF